MIVLRPLLALIVALAIVPQPATAIDPGYDIWFAGQIVSVDFRRGMLVIAHGPTQTSGPALETCRLGRSSLQRVRAGMEIEAQADTHRRPWTILHLRVFEITPVKKNPLQIALRG